MKYFLKGMFVKERKFERTEHQGKGYKRGQGMKKMYERIN